MSTRRRPTELARETRRRATTVAIALGQEVRLERRRRRWTQTHLATLVGLSQPEISRIERGLGARAPLETWVSLGVVLGRPLAVALSRPLGEPRDPADAGHLDIQEHILALGRVTGRRGTFELPTRPSDPSRSTDVGLRDPGLSLRILAECWNTFGDLGAAVRATRRKAAEAAATWPEDRIASIWVVRDTAMNRKILARFPEVVDAAFPGSSRRWVHALTHAHAEPPIEPGLVWFDAATGRLREHRRARMTG